MPSSVIYSSNVGANTKIGHKYYYNAETKASTYTRPTIQAQGLPVQPTDQSADFISLSTDDTNSSGQQWNGFSAKFGGSISSGGFQRSREPKRPQLQDRPKHKHKIQGCEPWILVTTRLKRRFVHNTETGESLWKFPDHVLKAVVEWDVQKLKQKHEEPPESKDPNEEGSVEDEEEEGGAPRVIKPAAPGPIGSDSEEEYEEVEVTDDEDSGEDGPAKRPRTDEAEDDVADDAPLEFNEDDIAYQLEAMGHEYGLDEGEYGVDEGAELDEGAEGLPLTEDDSKALFRDLLEDHGINPYRTWDQVLEAGTIYDDDRYTALPNMRSRRETFADWSREKIQTLKEQREREEKKDPKIPYMTFLQQKATPKLYWPEFKRKFKKEPEMRDTKVSDKDKEKWYREHIKRLQLPESSLKSDLSALLKAQPLVTLNASTSVNALPPAVLGDLRYISLSADVRDPLIEAYISTLPPAPEDLAAAEEDAEAIVRRQERAKREKALAERLRRVEEEKRRQARELEFGKGRLREEEYELERAMRVDDRGLKSQLD